MPRLSGRTPDPTSQFRSVSSQAGDDSDVAEKKAFADAGHDIAFDAIMFVPGSNSARARPSEYALEFGFHTVSPKIGAPR